VVVGASTSGRARRAARDRVGDAMRHLFATFVLLSAAALLAAALVSHFVLSIEPNSCDDYLHVEQMLESCFAAERPWIASDTASSSSTASALIHRPYRYQRVYHRGSYSLYRFHAPIPRLWHPMASSKEINILGGGGGGNGPHVPARDYSQPHELDAFELSSEQTRFAYSRRALLFVPGHGGSARQSIPLAMSLTIAAWQRHDVCSLLLTANRDVERLLPNRAASDANTVSPMIIDAARRLFAGRLASRLEDAALDSLDVFAVDFAGELTLMHGTMLEAQAQFVADSIDHIHRLYARQQNNSSSVQSEQHESETLLEQPTIDAPSTSSTTRRLSNANDTSHGITIVAHSMGGIVSRLALMNLEHQMQSVDPSVFYQQPQPQPAPAIDGSQRIHHKQRVYRRRAVESIVTIGTPLVSAPGPTDPYVADIYQRLNRFWMQQPETNAAFDHLLTVSIAGGFADNLVLTELTDANWFQSPEHHVRARDLARALLMNYNLTAPSLPYIGSIQLCSGSR